MDNDKAEPNRAAGTRRRGRPFNSFAGSSLGYGEALEAALKIVERKGLKALSMQLLAKDLGVSRAPIYSHFKSRDELVSAVIDHTLNRVLEQNALEIKDWKQRLRQIAMTILDTNTRYPEVAAEMVRTGFPDTEAGRKASRAFARVFASAGANREEIPTLILTFSALTLGLDLELRGLQQLEATGRTSQKRMADIDLRRGTTLPRTPLGEESAKQAVEILILGTERFLEK